MLFLLFVRTLWALIMWPVNLLPTWQLPDAIATTGGSAYGQFGTLGNYASSLDAWFPFDQVAAVTGAMVAVLGVAIALWFVRRVGAGIPFIGGFFGDG